MTDGETLITCSTVDRETFKGSFETFDLASERIEAMPKHPGLVVGACEGRFVMGSNPFRTVDRYGTVIDENLPGVLVDITDDQAIFRTGEEVSGYVVDR